VSRADDIERWMAERRRVPLWGPPASNLTRPDERRQCAEWFDQQLEQFLRWNLERWGTPTRDDHESGTTTDHVGPYDPNLPGTGADHVYWRNDGSE
jgi:hypothetical protein